MFLFPWLGLYSAIGIMVALSIETEISRWTRTKIGMFWIITVPILLISQLLKFKEESCSNDPFLSSLSSHAQTPNEQSLFSPNLDIQTSASQDIDTSVAVNTMPPVLDLEPLLQQDIRLLAQSVVVDMRGVARVVPSALINKN